MNFLKTFFVRKRAGFYLGLLGSLLIMAFLFVFLGNYGSSVYMDALLVILPLLGFIAFIGLSFYKPLEGIGPMILAFLSMGSFCVFMYRTYGYLSEVFFAGVNAEAFAAMKPQYAACVILLLLALIISIVSIFVKKSVSDDDKKTETNVEVEEK